MVQWDLLHHHHNTITRLACMWLLFYYPLGPLSLSQSLSLYVIISVLCWPMWLFFVLNLWTHFMAAGIWPTTPNHHLLTWPICSEKSLSDRVMLCAATHTHISHPMLIDGFMIKELNFLVGVFVCRYTFIYKLFYIC